MTRPLSNCCTWGCNTWPKSGPSPFQSGKPPSINSSCCLGSGCRCEKSYTLNLTTSEFRSFDAGYWSSWDRASALHTQTILAYGMNGHLLHPDHGAPLRLYSAVKL